MASFLKTLSQIGIPVLCGAFLKKELSRRRHNHFQSRNRSPAPTTSAGCVVSAVRIVVERNCSLTPSNSTGLVGGLAVEPALWCVSFDSQSLTHSHSPFILESLTNIFVVLRASFSIILPRKADCDVC